MSKGNTYRRLLDDFTMKGAKVVGTILTSIHISKFNSIETCVPYVSEYS